MPPFRRRYKKRYFKKRRYSRKYGKGLAPRRSGGFFGVRKTMLQAEKKFLDTQLSSTFYTATPFVQLINGVGAGTAFNERVGRKIRIKSIQLNFNVTISTVTPVRCRILVVIDRQANGVAPTFSNVLDTSVITQFSKAFMNLDNRARFSVIFDKKFTLDTVTYTLKDYGVFKKKIVDVTYNGITTGIGSIATNSIYFMAVADSVQTGAPSVYGGARIRYTDV